ncbi:hypothetical protein [Clostridium sp.]|uniref:hypothetical protein n=1 Tax=Clostridium sp. TaxID=1506 RepID=UPI003216A567
MKKHGKVINFDNDKVYVVTDDNEFVTIERNSTPPIKGSTYSGVQFVDRSNMIKIFSILIFVSIIVITSLYFIFFAPRASIIISLGSNIKLDINNNKIVKITDSSGVPLDTDNFNSLKGNELNDGLSILFDTALNKEIIPICDEYSKGNIYVYITKSHKKEPLNFDVFKEYAYKFNYELIVNRNDNVLTPN